MRKKEQNMKKHLAALGLALALSCAAQPAHAEPDCDISIHQYLGTLENMGMISEGYVLELPYGSGCGLTDIRIVTNNGTMVLDSLGPSNAERIGRAFIDYSIDEGGDDRLIIKKATAVLDGKRVNIKKWIHPRDFKPRKIIVK